jgi:integrase/recombinase XerD|uniref:Integrase n=1 Tax=Caudovirales sp. ct1Jx6 TaxID=2826765 RepID=A0A8S5MLD2_9CAUD|nr:MAG TPA: Integrase [Caudovirales sp. ct1Jx6]
MKRKPNNYGTIKKLSGSRENPYAALTPWKRVNGKKKREPIGYFSTYEEADYALALWNRNRGSKINYSLNELYEEWSEKALPKISRSTADCYRAAWKQMGELQNFKVRIIRTGHFQDLIDKLQDEKSYSSLHNIKVLAGLLEKYAMQYDIIDKNYAEFITLPDKPREEKEIFSEPQIETLEAAAENGDKVARLIVILNYTGWRISEFLNLTADDYDPVNRTFRGGLKTENGKNRIVPVHPQIQGYINELLAQNGPRLVCREVERGRSPNKYTELVPITPNYFRKYMFGETLDKLGIRRSDGEQFTPHVTRHTFASVCHKRGVDPLVTKKLLGHSPKADITEKTYIHVDLEMLNTGISRLKSSEQSKTTE